MISRRVLLSVAVACGVGIATSVRRAVLSRQADQDDRAVPAGRADRHHGAPRGAGHVVGLGQQVMVENRPGAGSTIGSKAVASADPDGYTLLFGSSGSLGVAPALYANARSRSGQVVRADRQRVAAAACHGGAGVGASQDACRSSSPTPRPIPASSTSARVSARRRICSATLFKSKAGHRHHLRALQGRGAVGDRPARRADALHHRRHADPDAAHQGRQAPRARRRRARSAGPNCPTCRPGGERLSRFHHRRLDRRGRARRHAAADHREAQRARSTPGC